MRCTNLLLTSLVAVLCSGTPAPNNAPRATSTCVAVKATPSPKNAVCGAYCQLNKPSEVYYPDTGNSSPPDPPASCALQCLQHSTCVSFTYEAHFGYCGFFNKTIKDQGYQSSTSTDLSCYDAKCYKRKCS